MIRKIALSLALTGTCYALKAQHIDDALRYSTTNIGGSSRVQSIGGAAGSLGGDYSSMFINPAGVAFFKTSEAAFSIGFQHLSNKGTYLGTTASDNKGNLYINSGAFIFGGTKKRASSKWQNFSFGIGVNRINNYNETVYYRGLNTQSSISYNYAGEANGITNPDQLSQDPRFAHSADLAYNTYLIEPFLDDNNQPDGGWYSLAQEVVDEGGGIMQENSIRTEGSAYEVNLSFGGNYNDQLYIGGSLNMPTYRYERTKTFSETNTTRPGALLNYFDVTEDLKTEGVGFNTKLGVIYRPIAPLRLGLTFASPTWASFTDTYVTSMATSTTDQGLKTANSTETNNGYADESRYNVTTPWKGTASASYIFRPAGGDMTKPSGFISVDYEYMDYAAMKMKMKNGGTSDQEESNARNQAIDATYQAVSNFRVGGELKLNIFAIRAGFAYYGNPYQDNQLDGSRTFYTGGLGYRNKGIYIDLAVIYGNNTRLDQPYTMLPNQLNIPSPDPAEIKSSLTNVTATVGFKF